MTFALLLHLLSYLGLAVGLVNPKWVLPGIPQKRATAAIAYSVIWLTTLVAVGMLAPTDSQPVAEAPVTPIPTTTPTPATAAKEPQSIAQNPPVAVQSPTEPVELEPPVVETSETQNPDGSSHKETKEVKKYRDPDRSLRTLTHRTEKTVERGKITTKTETITEKTSGGAIAKTIQIHVTTETPQDTTIKTENIAENGVISKEETKNDEVSAEVLETLKIADSTSTTETNNAAFEPTPAPVSVGVDGYYDYHHKKRRRRRR